MQYSPQTRLVRSTYLSFQQYNYIKWSYDPCRYERNFCNCVKKSEKFKTSTGVRCSNQLSHEATDIGSWSFVGSNVPVRNESTMKWYMKWTIYELRIRNQMKLWSSQLWTQFSFIWFHIRRSYMITFIYHFIIDSFLTGTLEPTNDHLSTSVASWLSWLERRTGIARSRVQTPLKSWIFQASLRNCKNCVHNCEDHSLIWFYIRSSYMIHFIYHFIVSTIIASEI